MMNRSVLLVLFSLIPLPAFARETPPIGASSPVVRAAPAAPADEPVPSKVNPAIVNRHGVYLRGELGAGYRSIAIGGADLSVSGPGVGATMLLGGSLRPNLFLVGELTLNNILNPSVRSGDQSSKPENTRALIVGVGPGIVYHLMPANVSIGASFLFAHASISQDDVEVGETQLGYGGSARIGKEWWVGAHSSLGVGGQIMLASLKDKGKDTAHVLAASYTLSALFTY